MTAEIVGFRIADWTTPLRVNPSRHAGRYHHTGQVAQYLCEHPLGPAAEYLRRERPPYAALAEFRHRIWAVKVAVADAVEIGWSNAEAFGISPQDLVADDHTGCRRLADRLRDEGTDTIIVPNAALPGTRNIVILRPCVALPYGARPRRRGDLPVAVVAEDATIPPELWASVRSPGASHVGLEAWREGTAFVFEEPDVPGHRDA